MRKLVYRIACKRCRKTHIGSTIRKLRDRIREHLTTVKSSVLRHLSECQNTTKDVEVTIVERDTDTILLSLKEAYSIRKEKPELNSREERLELAELMF